MLFTQYYLDCLSQASYLIGDEATGRAVVVDPQRDVDQYLQEAEAAGLSIEHVIETHFHADFLSGHLELAAATGADICYGPTAQADFPIRNLSDGERIELGEVQIEVRATPGHTPESVSLVVYEHSADEVPYGVLTGDTLFIGDVGRPDLMSAEEASADQMARQLYHSLHSKLLTLPDPTRVFPAHGAGSACGKNLSTETRSTIGEQRRTNHALAPMSEDQFVVAVTEGQPLTPPYFSFDAHRNREAHPLLDEHEPPPALSLDEALKLQADGAVVLDTRSPVDFAAGHLRGSLNVGLEGRFAEFTGDVLPGPDQEIVLLGEPGTELAARVRLGRIGFDNVVGYVARGPAAFLDRPELVERSSRVTAEELSRRLVEVDELVVVDVRNPGEVVEGRIAGARHVPLPRLRQELPSLDPKRPTVAYCAGGYRSSIAASLLGASGFDDVSDLLGGYTAWISRESMPT
jgi:hydroxyacylglutathione hydrolase